MSSRPARRSRCWTGFLLAGAGLIVAMSGMHGGVLSAQRRGAPPASPAGETFEVATVRPSRAGGPSRISMPAGGQFTATNASLRLLIRFAYQVQDFQIIGGPRWVGTDTFDIDAKRASDLAPELGGTPRLRARLRGLLAERFSLKLRNETREQLIYDLVVATRDGKPDARLRRSSIDCAALTREYMGRPPAARGAPPEALTRCGVRLVPGKLTAEGITLAQFSRTVSRMIGRAVEDRTGLDEPYDIEIELPESPALLTADTSDASADAGHTLFSALEDQLGLRLEPKRGPVDVLVIAEVRRPAQ